VTVKDFLFASRQLEVLKLIPCLSMH